jgi:hypothetical protein
MSGHQKTQQNARPQKSERASKPEKQTGQKVDPQQMLEAPETMRPEDILAAQQSLGNQVVQRAVDKDPKRESATDEQGNLLPELSDAINQSRGGGAPLPGDVQSEAKKSLGRSFKDVRLHTDEQADQISRRISARAFTIGKDIFFKKGAYAPGSSQGRETLIHELTHVVQQSGGKGSSGTLKLGDPGSAMEQQADKLGKKAVQGVTKSSSAQVQRMPAEEEELQMQSEEEEEMLQMQSEEEEELQMQGEEEELQMQPDASGVVQRKWVKDGDEWKKEDTPTENPATKTKAPARNQLKMLNTAIGAGEMLGKEGEIERGGKKIAANPWKTPGMTDKQSTDVGQTSRKKYETNTELLKKTGGTDEGKAEKNSADRMKAIEKSEGPEMGPEAKRSKAFSDDMKQNYTAEKDQAAKKKAEEKEKFEKTVPGQRIMLVNKLKDPNTSSTELKKIEEKLTKLHKANPQLIKDAKAERSNKLKEAAQRGDDKAYDQMSSEEAAEEESAKAEKEKNPSKAKKFGGFMKKAGLGLAKGIGGMIADQGKDGLKHFLGVDTGKDDDDDDEKEEKKGKKGGKPDKGGGGDGGSAVGTIMEKYAEVVEENKKLKAMLEKKGA